MRDTDAAEPHDKSRKKVLEMGRLQLEEPGHRLSSPQEGSAGIVFGAQVFMPLNPVCSPPVASCWQQPPNARRFLTLGRGREKGPGQTGGGAPGRMGSGMSPRLPPSHTPRPQVHSLGYFPKQFYVTNARGSLPWKQPRLAEMNSLAFQSVLGHVPLRQGGQK